jgi:hypothetical protein
MGSDVPTIDRATGASSRSLRRIAKAGVLKLLDGPTFVRVSEF